MQPNQVQPIVILPESTQRSTGKNAQRTNILAARLVADAVRTTLGPKGMDKMLVDSVGDVTVTNDGVTILEEMHVEHPAAKMIVEVARTQEDQIGDGTTSAVILAGELLRRAEKLLDEKIHPTTIIKGYRMAEKQALRILENQCTNVESTDTSTLQQIAQTAMTGKGAESAKESLAKIAVQAVLATNDDQPKRAIKREKKIGGSIEDTQFIQGIVLDKEKTHPTMPSKIENAKILLLDTSVEVKETGIDAKVSITDPSQLQAFLDMEHAMLKKMVSRIVSSGANVVLCQKGIDDVASYELAKQNILAVRRISKTDMERLQRATGASIITNIDDIQTTHVGNAGIVHENTIGDDSMLFVEKCPNAKAITLLIRGGTQHIIDEVERAISDALGDIKSALTSGQIVAGAGAIEVELSQGIAEFAKTLTGREQLAVDAFAQSLTIIPRTLAENAGLDPINVLADLRAAHQTNPLAGIDVFSGKVIDAMKTGVIEPMHIKTQAISSATDVAAMILRIDDVIASGPVDSRMPPE